MKKHDFQGKHVFLTKNGLIRVGLLSIKYLNKERQPLTIIWGFTAVASLIMGMQNGQST